MFVLNDIHHYQPPLQSMLTSDSVVIHVPFKSGDAFEVYQLESFPFSAKGYIMTLDLPSSMVLIHSDFSFYATGRLPDLQTCHTLHISLYFCSASLSEFLPPTTGV